MVVARGFLVRFDGFELISTSLFFTAREHQGLMKEHPKEREVSGNMGWESLRVVFQNVEQLESSTSGSPDYLLTYK